MKKISLGEMTYEEAKEWFKKIDIAIIPVGSIEQHGPHLPLDTDAFDAAYTANEVAKRVKDPKPVVLPPINYGVSYHHMDFTGTISISPETLSNMVYEICLSLIKHGIKKIVIINGHGGNIPALECAAQKIKRETNAFVCIDTGNIIAKERSEIIETKNDIHCGEYETSTSLANRPHLVEMGKAEKGIPTFSSRYLQFGEKDRVVWAFNTNELSKKGIIGDATKATREKGEVLLKTMINNLTSLIEDLKKMEVETKR